MHDGDDVTKEASIHPFRYGFEGDWLALPIVLVAALAECDVPLAGFIDRIRLGSVWQDEAIRSSDRRIVVQAHLAVEGLRALVRIGEKSFYHTSAETLHMFGLVLPATVMAARDVPAFAIIDDPLIQLPGVVIRRLRPLSHRDPKMGTAALLDVPTIMVRLRQT